MYFYADVIVGCNMNKIDRLEYLKQKRANYKSRVNLEKRENDLNQFLSELNNIEPELVKVSSCDIDIKSIASPNLYNKPESPVYTELRFKSIEEELNVKNTIRQWILEQTPKPVLCKNQLLIDDKDWLEINTESLNRNFDLLFDKLDILYTIMVVPENGNFINLFEFEFDVTIYKGTIKNNEIKYYI